MYTIPFTDIITDVASLTNIVSDIHHWINGESGLPDFIKKDNYKKRYDANIVTTILIDRIVPEIGSRDDYCDKYQTLARNLMKYLFNDVPATSVMTWKEFVAALAFQGIGYAIFGDTKSVVDLEELTGVSSEIVLELISAVANAFWDYPSEFASIISNISNAFDNHSTQLNVIYAQIQDSYYQEWYKEYYFETFDTLVPYRNNAAFFRFSCIDINQGEIHNKDKGSSIVLRMTGSDTEWSSIINFDPGYAVGYYHYASHERTEWFMPAFYNYAYGFYDYSLHSDHLIEIDLLTYYTNVNDYRDWETIYIDPDVSYNIEEAVTGSVDKIVDNG